MLKVTQPSHSHLTLSVPREVTGDRIAPRASAAEFATSLWRVLFRPLVAAMAPGPASGLCECRCRTSR